MDGVIGSAIAQDFVPKDRKDKWRVFFGANTFSGYDFVLVIENPETKVCHELEVGILEDGRLCGQISPDGNGDGADALLIFDTSPKTAQVSDNWGRKRLVVNNDDIRGSTVADGTQPTMPRGFY
jgi:hypothetical protein